MIAISLNYPHHIESFHSNTFYQINSPYENWYYALNFFFRPSRSSILRHGNRNLKTWLGWIDFLSSHAAFLSEVSCQKALTWLWCFLTVSHRGQQMPRSSQRKGWRFGRPTVPGNSWTTLGSQRERRATWGRCTVSSGGTLVPSTQTCMQVRFVTTTSSLLWSDKAFFGCYTDKVFIFTITHSPFAGFHASLLFFKYWLFLFLT